MRLCQKMLCEEAADVYFHGPWCAPHCLERYGKDTISMEARLGDLRHALKETSAPRPAEAVAPEAAPDREAGLSLTPSSSGPAPGPISVEDFEWILENDGWRESEWELLAGRGWLVPDTERFLKAHLNEGMEP